MSKTIERAINDLYDACCEARYAIEDNPIEVRIHKLYMDSKRMLDDSSREIWEAKVLISDWMRIAEELDKNYKIEEGSR